MSVQPVSVAQYGIGPIGAEIARLLLTKPWVKLVAAVDIDPNKIGKDVGEVIGLGRAAGVKVTPDLQGKPEVVCHSTGSRLREVSSQLKSLLERGCHVVSTCEELSFPLDQQIRADVQPGKIKHMGLRESLMLVGNGLGVEFEKVSDEKIEPIVAEREVVTQYLRVAPGQVAGVHQTIDGKGKINVRLELRMYVGAEDVAADRVIVKGVPDLEMEIKGGVHGDRATAAMVVNAIPRVISARPGVLTMDDIPISFR